MFRHLASKISVLVMIISYPASAYMGNGDCSNSVLNLLIMQGDLNEVAKHTESYPLKEQKILWFVLRPTRAAYINQPDGCGAYALRTAAFRGRPDVVRYLLSQGADPNVKIKNGGRRETILLSCLYTEDSSLIKKYPLSGQIESLETLIQAGADINHLNSDKKTALDLCSNPEYRKTLIKNGAKKGIDLK